MLNPIDPETVIRDGGAAGRYPDEIHEGVAWWVGACLVVATRAARIAVAHDGNPTSLLFHRRLCRGVMNAQHFACTIHDLHHADRVGLLAAMKELGGAPGAMVTTTSAGGVETVAIMLFDRHGEPLAEEAGLARIRQMIADDQVPRPVNDQARGCLKPYSGQEGAGQ
ncbi:hypothetical protein ACQEVS_08105 [Streptomyces sp. CA-181903]|uniref:hypothetical protein n=1 Tax=Streptomyces sp. CA-181903 TaxID=3240055 RepID=UPI003D917DA4